MDALIIYGIGIYLIIKSIKQYPYYKKEYLKILEEKEREKEVKKKRKSGKEK